MDQIQVANVNVDKFDAALSTAKSNTATGDVTVSDVSTTAKTNIDPTDKYNAW